MSTQSTPQGRGDNSAQMFNRQTASYTTKLTSESSPPNPGSLAAIKAHRNLGTLSNLPVEVRELIWFYTLKQYQPTEYPVEQFLAYPLVLHNTTISSISHSPPRPRLPAARRTKTSRPFTSCRHVTKSAAVPHERAVTSCTIWVAKHIRIHIRFSRDCFKDDWQDGLTAWQTALAAFPTGNLYSLSVSFDVIDQFWYYTTDALVILLRFMRRLTIGVKIKSRGQCYLILEGQEEVVGELQNCTYGR
jgi:hypothetical protein